MSSAAGSTATSLHLSYQDIKKGKELGQGSFGVVYQGEWHHTDVAIKELALQQLPQKAQEEFEQETTVMRELRHPNVVLLYGICLTPTRCMVMEYCANGSLYDQLQSPRPIEVQTRTQWALDIAKGLFYLHEKNILHRDLKSLNVLIDKNLNPKIADFGLSRIKLTSSSNRTLQGKMTGTIRWMAPEIMDDEEKVPYTPASDIYSYGMIVWELATRKIPFESVPKEPLVIARVLQGKRESFPPGTSPLLETITKGCWKQTPKERMSLNDVIQTLKKNPEEKSQPPPSYAGGLSSGKGPSPAIPSSYVGGLQTGAPIPPPAASAAVAPAPPSLPEIAFGKAKWATYFGDIGIEPPLPPNIEEILSSPCPFWPDKRVRETHLLTLIPQTLNGRPFNLNLLKDLIQRPQGGGHSTQYRYYDDDVQKELGDQPVSSSYWVLMTRDVIPDSRNKTYDDQKALIQKHAQKSGISYALPKGLEATTAILMHYVETGKAIYTDDELGEQYTLTRCQEKVDNNRWPVAIGGFSSGGLGVVHISWSDYDVGVGCCRKF